MNKNINSYRYRGYYYDTETGLYYLNSRYYSPEFGTFININGIKANGNNGSVFRIDWDPKDGFHIQ